MDRRAIPRGLALSLRAGVAGGLAIATAQAAQLPYPVYALIAAVIVTDLEAVRTRRLGLQRLLSTVVGALWGAGLGMLLPSGPWSVMLGVVLAMASCHLFRASEAAKVAGYVAGIVLLDHTGDPWIYTSMRLVETTIGVIASWLVSLVPKLMDLGSPESDGN